MTPSPSELLNNQAGDALEMTWVAGSHREAEFQCGDSDQQVRKRNTVPSHLLLWSILPALRANSVETG